MASRGCGDADPAHARSVHGKRSGVSLSIAYATEAGSARYNVTVMRRLDGALPLRRSELRQLLPIVTIATYAQRPTGSHQCTLTWNTSLNTRNRRRAHRIPARMAATTCPSFLRSFLAFPPNHPPPRTSPDRSSGRDNDLRDGTARRISTSVCADRALRRLGSGSRWEAWVAARKQASFRRCRQVNRA